MFVRIVDSNDLKAAVLVDYSHLVIDVLSKSRHDQNRCDPGHPPASNKLTARDGPHTCRNVSINTDRIWNRLTVRILDYVQSYKLDRVSEGSRSHRKILDSTFDCFMLNSPGNPPRFNPLINQSAD